MDMLRKILSRSGPGVTSSRIRRRRALVSLISRRLPYIRAGLFVVGYLWMAALPLPWLGWATYIDENALQPGQVTPSPHIAIRRGLIYRSR
jgi:GPI-anchor transamidase subunit GAA1